MEYLKIGENGQMEIDFDSLAFKVSSEMIESIKWQLQSDRSPILGIDLEEYVIIKEKHTAVYLRTEKFGYRFEQKEGSTEVVVSWLHVAHMKLLIEMGESHA